MAAMDKFERFEAWLLENRAVFEQLELREYPSSSSCSPPEESSGPASMQFEEENGNAEEKKDAVNDIVVAVDECEYNDSKNEGNTCSSSATDMRGVFCKSEIAPNTVCMAVPRKCLITVEMGQATNIGQLILNADLDLDAPKHIFLMIYILQDRLNPGSFFQPYYDVLPEILSMPIFWDEDDLQYLEGSYLLQQIADRVEAIEEDYKSICDVCPQLSEIATLGEFKWARMCVCSRNFGLQIDGARTSAMVPHADMLNHYRPRETKWTFDEERQAFTITTLQTVQSGSEIFDSYGQKCNHRFLLNYGFAVEHNVELDGFCPNEVPLEVALLNMDPLYGKKMEFWCREEMPLRKRVRICVSNNENTKMLFSLLRVIVADAMELEAMMSSGTSSNIPLSACMPTSTATTSKSSSSSANAAATIVRNHHNASDIGAGSSLHTALSGYRTCRDIRFPISIRNETAMLQHLLQLTRKCVSHYPTTMAQDKEALQKNSGAGALLPFSNQRHATIQVLGEKEVLHYYEELALTGLRMLALEEEDHFNAAVKSLEGSEQYFQIIRYCADSIGSLRRREQKRRKATGVTLSTPKSISSV